MDIVRLGILGKLMGFGKMHISFHVINMNLFLVFLEENAC